jgi:hypothetical protein
MDLLLVEFVGDVGGFDKKLQGLEKTGAIGANQRQYLAAALDAGSAASHRGFSPDPESLNHVLDIVENVLQSLYILGGAAAELRRTTPQRSRVKRRP